MAKGYEKYQERVNALSRFGKDLVRRSGSKCELCEATGVKLAVYEVEPVEQEPHFDDCIFICEACREQLSRPKNVRPNHWRCLNNTLWSDVPAVQVIALRVLKRLTGQGEAWAEELLEMAYPSEEISNWAAMAE